MQQNINYKPSICYTKYNLDSKLIFGRIVPKSTLWSVISEQRDISIALPHEVMSIHNVHF